MTLADLRKFSIRKQYRIHFRLRNAMECVISEHGIAQVPSLNKNPDFNLEEELAAAGEFLVEPAVVVDRKKPEPHPQAPPRGNGRDAGRRARRRCRLTTSTRTNSATPVDRRGLQHIKIAGYSCASTGRGPSFFGCCCSVSAAGALRGQTTVSLGASSNGSSAGCALSGGQTCTLTARVTGLANSAVTFTFSPTVAGVMIGTPTGPDGTGLSRITYIAPTLITSRQTVTATATAIDGAKAQTQITLVPPAITVQVNPATVTLTGGQTQLFTASVFGISSTGVTWSISPLVGSINPNSGLYVAPSAISTTQKITVTATSTFDTNVSGTASLTLQAPTTVSVTVSPSSASLTNGDSQQFTATVQNAASNAVAWSISPQLGTIDSSGLYTAPALISSSTKVTLTATSVSDPTKSGAASITISPLVDVGAGAPTSTIQSAFIAAFNRLGLVNTVVLPPLGLVKANGTAGYLQEFTDARDTSQKDALVTASATVGANVVVQVLAPLYAYYSTVGSGTAGYPLADSQGCPASGNPCTYAFFDKGYALFSYSTSLTGGQNFSVSGTNYTEWTNLGGISGLGAPVSEAIAITASSATTAAEQDFTYGAIFSITSGTYKGKIFGVAAPVYDLYVTQGGAAGPLGLPIGEAALVATGVYKQSFEGGVLQYTSGGGGPVVQLPVKSVSLSGGPSSGNTTLNLGQTLTLTAIPVATDGTVLTDRPVSWSTTNSKVISIQASGATAVITAVGRWLREHPGSQLRACRARRSRLW